MDQESERAGGSGNEKCGDELESERPRLDSRGWKRESEKQREQKCA